MKDLTIVVPLYNKCKYIERCLESIRGCVHNLDWECIVVDDGSTDGSTEVAKDYCNKFPENYTYLQCLRNHGHYPSYARNVGIRMAESDYIMFFDADDLMCDGYPERGVQFMRENPDYYLYFESIYVVDKEVFEDNYFEYYSFVPFEPITAMDYPGFVNFGGGAYTRSIFRTDEVKKYRFKDMLFEDSIFMLDYLYPMKKFKLDTSKFCFYYFVCRSEQDVMAMSKNKEDNQMTDREYIYEYVKNQYPDYFKTFIETNNQYKVELKNNNQN